jgi:adenosylmethionine-8-amino-7-oxononanoate aminotransferase
VVLSSNAIYDAFYSDNIRLGFLHSHSFTGNPLACTAALATLSIFEDDDYLTKIQCLVGDLKDAFSWVEQDTRAMNLRQLGTILAFDIKSELISPRFSKEFYAQGLEHGLLIRPIGNTVYVMPPYILNHDQVQFLGSMVQSTLNSVCPS